MEWQQDQDPEISVKDVFEITLDVDPESTFKGNLEYVEDSEGEDYPISPPPTFTGTSSAATNLYSWRSNGIRTLCWGKNWKYFT